MAANKTSLHIVNPDRKGAVPNKSRHAKSTKAKRLLMPVNTWKSKLQKPMRGRNLKSMKSLVE